MMHPNWREKYVQTVARMNELLDNKDALETRIAELEDGVRQAHAFLGRGAYDGDGWIARAILERLLPKDNDVSNSGTFRSNVSKGE